MAYYGRKWASEPDVGATFSGANQRGQIYYAMPEHGWIYAVGVLGGKASGQPNLAWRGAVFAVSGATLSTRLGYTAQITVSNTMTYGGDGVELSANLVTPIQAWSGVKYGIGWSVTGGTFIHGMSQAANSPTGADDYYFHYKGNASSTPTDPFGATSTSYEGAMTNWYAYDANVAPTVT